MIAQGATYKPREMQSSVAVATYKSTDQLAATVKMGIGIYFDSNTDTKAN